MDRCLLSAALILFVFGGLLLVRPDIVKRVSDFLNRSILPVEEKMRSAHVISGAILVISSIIVLYLAIKK